MAEEKKQAPSTAIPIMDIIMGKKKSQADRLVEYSIHQKIQPFIDQRQMPHMTIDGDDGAYREIWPIRSSRIKAWLAGLMYKEEKRAPGSEAIAAALNVIEAMAYDYGVIPLYNRVAKLDDCIWVDMSDPGWSAVKVNEDGWRVASPPVIFRRYAHQTPLPFPDDDGDLWELFDFVNIGSEKQRLLFAVTVVSYFVPEVPHVVFTMYGPQGSGKTFAMRAARSIIDPSLMTTMTLPRDQREFVQQLFHNYFAPYDNVGDLPFWMSDILCRAVTGTGVSKRRLYTDEEDIIFSYFRCIGLTGINIAATRGDLLERSLLIGLEAISEHNRRTEEQLGALLEEKRPKIFGGVLNTLRKAMSYYPHIEVDGLFRMADYTKWGAAISEALDVDMGVFLKAYKENIAEQYLEAIKVNPVAEVLLAFLESRPDRSWEGSPTALHGNLCEIAEQMKVSTRQSAWPKNAAALGRRLNEIAPSLPYAGYNMQYTRTVEGRLIILNPVNPDNLVREGKLI